MKEKILTNGNVTLLNDEDYEFFKDRKCYEHSSGYATFWDKENKKVLYVHRFLVNPPDDMKVDHINRNKLDNQRDNLRVCTSAQNQYNTGKIASYTSKYQGVSFCKQTKKWRVTMRIDGKCKTVGRYATEKEAALTYNKMAKKHRGEFAYINGID